MNFHDMQQYLRQSVENLVPPEYYLHRKAPLSEKTLPNLKFPRSGVHQLLDTIRIPSGKQFVLRGLASEGKPQKSVALLTPFSNNWTRLDKEFRAKHWCICCPCRIIQE